MLRAGDKIKFREHRFSNTLKEGILLKVEFNFHFLERNYWVESNDKLYKVKKRDVFEVKRCERMK